MKKTIEIEKQNIPNNWTEELISKQLVGGVVYVFLSAENKEKLNLKLELLKKFCKEELKTSMYKSNSGMVYLKR